MGTLNLYASGTGNNELETNPIWSISGDQGDQWIQGEASLSSNTPYSVNLVLNILQFFNTIFF